MAYYTYNNSTGALVQVSDFPIDTPDNCTTSCVDITKAEIDSSYIWDAERLDFISKPTNILTKREFLKRLTATEYAAVKTATASNGIIDYYWQLFMVAENIDLTDPDTIVGINTLEQLGLIAVGRASQILT